MDNTHWKSDHKQLDNNSENAFLKPRYEYLGSGKAGIRNNRKKDDQRPVALKVTTEEGKNREDPKKGAKDVAYDRIYKEIQKINLKIEQIENNIAHIESHLANGDDIPKKQPKTVAFIGLIILLIICAYLLLTLR